MQALRILLIIDGDRNILADVGAGNWHEAKFVKNYGLQNADFDFESALADYNLSTDDITDVILTHLHFDHFGGSTMRQGEAVVPRFRNARYLIRRDEWHDATHTHVRNRASYLPENFLPLADAGVIDFIETDGDVLPGISVWQTGGHCLHHQW